LRDQFNYEPVRVVGHGAYAKVVLANSPRHNNKVAIKVISKTSGKPDFVDKFLPREIEIVKKLRHPYLISFLQTIETNTRVYLVMEFCSRGCMLDLIRKVKRLTEPASGIWFRQITDAVEYMHSVGVVHRDLKCENLLIDSQFAIKIIDFGFARTNMLPMNGAYKLSETFCGSYAYACPEILTGTPYVSQMADIWSIGVILYVFVIGELPFSTVDKKTLLRQAQAGPEFEHKACSSACMRLLEAILVEEDKRLWFPDIRLSKWYHEHCVHFDESILEEYDFLG
ncbi:hypothetical protein HELRODRAFT_63833, partial [Helobdella robusta]